jgi:3-dehydroquinate dehydratase/shikimate dehydrogenase
MRDWKDDDFEHFARMNGDAVVMEYYPSRLDEKASVKLAKHFQEHIDKKKYGFFAVENKKTGAFMGFAGVSSVPSKMPFAPAKEMAWRLDYDYWGNGYAREAAQGILSYVFDEQELTDIVAYCSEENVRAQKALLALGFSKDSDEDFKFPGKVQDGAPTEYVLFRLDREKFEKSRG